MYTRNYYWKYWISLEWQQFWKYIPYIVYVVYRLFKMMFVSILQSIDTMDYLICVRYGFISFYVFLYIVSSHIYNCSLFGLITPIKYTWKLLPYSKLMRIYSALEWTTKYNEELKWARKSRTMTPTTRINQNRQLEHWQLLKCFFYLVGFFKWIFVAITNKIVRIKCMCGHWLTKNSHKI